MRYILTFIVIGLIFSACKKDKFTTAPQLSFKDVSPNFYSPSTAPSEYPVMTLHITDAEGDLGFIPNKDTSFLFIINLRTNQFDSIALFPNLATAAKANFEADINVNMKRFLGVPANRRDSIYYKIYVKDFAKNKSNVVITDKPVIYIP